MDRRPITIQDLLHLKFISDPQISPDGSKVIFSVKTINEDKNQYNAHLFMANIRTRKVNPFTYGEVLDDQPRWSPNGEMIAFLRTKESDSQIWMIPSCGGEARKLTTLDQGSFGSPEWSPSGHKIAFEFRPADSQWTTKAINERKDKGRSPPPRIITQLPYRKEGEGYLDHYQQIWVWDILSGESGPLTCGDWDNRDPVWSPDGLWLAFISNRSQNPQLTPFFEDIWRLPIEGGDPLKLPTPNGYKWGLSWSPDGKHIAYIGTETQDDPWCTHNDRLWIVPLSPGHARCLTESLDRIAENVTLSDVRGSGSQHPVWAKDGGHLFHLISDRGSCRLQATDLKGNSSPLIANPEDIYGFSLNKNSTRVAFLASDPTHPGEVHLLELGTNTSTPIQLTELNTQFLSSIDISQPEEIKFPSPDKTEIQGWILKPPHFEQNKKYPLVLYIHGGPAAQYGNTFFHEFQVLAARGFVILYTNPRGSLGRDESFATCIQGDWGHLDFQDLMAAADFGCTLPYIDPEKSAVVGGSYGGFMTTWIVGNTHRFKCAISERGISNRHSAVGCNDFPPLVDGYWPGNPWDQPDILWQQSPLRFAAAIDTPLLIIHSEGDWRCPISQAEQLFSALKKLNKETTFIRYPPETHHGLSRNGPPDLRLDRLHRIVDWLGNHLMTTEQVNNA